MDKWRVLATEDVKFWGDDEQSSLPMQQRAERLQGVLPGRTTDAIGKALKRPEYLAIVERELAKFREAQVPFIATPILPNDERSPMTEMPALTSPSPVPQYHQGRTSNMPTLRNPVPLETPRCPSHEVGEPHQPMAAGNSNREA